MIIRIYRDRDCLLPEHSFNSIGDHAAPAAYIAAEIPTDLYHHFCRIREAYWMMQEALDEMRTEAIQDIFATDYEDDEELI